MESENPHYDGGKPFIICKLSTIRTTPAVARFSLTPIPKQAQAKELSVEVARQAGA